jgi:hypothetical protein
MLPVVGSPAGSSFSTVDDLLRFDRALREGRLLDAERTHWVIGDAEGHLGVAGGAPGVSAILESDGHLTVIVLCNADPPSAEGLGLHLWRSLAESWKRPN